MLEDMEAIEELINLIKNVVVPQLKTMGKHVENLASETKSIGLSHERQKGRVREMERSIAALKCEENTAILQGMGSRMAKVEAKIDAGHAQNAECREKNRMVEEALRLAKENRQKNEEQEARHTAMLADQKDKNQKIINRLWMLIVAVMGAAATPYFQKLFQLTP